MNDQENSELEEAIKITAKSIVERIVYSTYTTENNIESAVKSISGLINKSTAENAQLRADNEKLVELQQILRENEAKLRAEITKYQKAPLCADCAQAFYCFRDTFPDECLICKLAKLESEIVDLAKEALAASEKEGKL